MATVAGIGVGLFILAFIWVLCLFVCLALSRAEGGVAMAAPGMILLAAVITIILWFLPQESATDVVEDVKIYDLTYIPRTALVSICGIMFVVGAAMYVVFHIFEPQKAHVLRKIKT